MPDVTRRDLLKFSGAAAAGMLAGPRLLRAASTAPAAPVAIARCRGYGKEVAPVLDSLFDKLGGLPGIVGGKTVSIKLNLTGGPLPAFEGRAVGRTFHPHPDVVLATCRALARAGARRIRLLEGWNPKVTAEKFFADCGYDLPELNAVGAKVEMENTNNRGSFRNYASLKVRHGGYLFPSFEMNRSYEDTDVVVSLAKMKNHYTAGVTLALKNCFGVAPCSFYGDDAGSERAAKSRGKILHAGTEKPPSPAATELDPKTPREPGYRVPRITVDLVNAMHPIELSIIDGVESVQGGEGPWVKAVRALEPGLLVAGLNPVCTDAVCTAVMGYDPAAGRGQAPFYNGDNTLKLAEEAGIGTADLGRIEVRGLSVQEALYRFEPRG